MNRVGIALFLSLFLLAGIPMPTLPFQGLVMAHPSYPTLAPITVALQPVVDLQTTDSEFARTAQALQDWVNHDVASVWPLPHVTVIVLPRQDDPTPSTTTTWVMQLADGPSPLSIYALGFHTIDLSGNPVGFVDVTDATENDIRWTQVLSHELAEMVVDPASNRTAFGPRAEMTYLLEVADPVQKESYLFGDRGHAYFFADYVYPNYFNINGRFPYDRLHLLTSPFSVLKDGYVAMFPLGSERAKSL